MSLNNGSLVICQTNHIRCGAETADSYNIGIVSIRRIANNYGGTAEVHSEDGIFEIKITLSDF